MELVTQYVAQQKLLKEKELENPGTASTSEHQKMRAQRSAAVRARKRKGQSLDGEDLGSSKGSILSFPKQILNSAATCVTDSVDGLLLTNSNLRRISGMNVVIRHDIESARDKYVSVISGGGAGHEPAHAGYVGNGMLAAAVLGGIFASPSVNSILAAIRVCSGACGVMMIVKNYTGDRLNFGWFQFITYSLFFLIFEIVYY